MRIAKIVPGVLIAGILVLTGCSASSDDAAEEMVENLIESGTGNEVEIGEDSLSMTDEQGGGFAAGEQVELPPDQRHLPGVGVATWFSRFNRSN